ncbi:hypothetical protein [Ruegeria faecimaris]|uniref:hypothetical protein n=1 Tax=Ruegeria faecimaris TaxID=686389 RepID=UPI00115AA780|nr:hypothetical protein [Ruegeria faecimaris]
MYPLGVYLARYIDWWHRRVAKAPLVWLVGITVSVIVFQIATVHMFENAVRWILPFVGIALLPGAWAAMTVHSNRMNQRKEATDQQEIAKKFIDKYAKEKSK